eukprot:363784-Chlamydomonas_euryale.AAC.11
MSRRKYSQISSTCHQTCQSSHCLELSQRHIYTIPNYPKTALNSTPPRRQVLDGEEVPADLLLLSAGAPGGVAYVETANLDGETNLKPRLCYGPTATLRTADELRDFAEQCHIVCEQPNARLYVFDGAVVGSADEGRQVCWCGGREGAISCFVRAA